MTLVLSYVTPWFALQVSDRLVTSSGRREDTQANKSIIFQARNAVVAIGYSGLAVISHGRPDERATDHWLVEQLIGEPIPEDFTGPAPRYNYDLGFAINAVRDGLSELPTSQGIDVVWCGFQWRGRQCARRKPVTGAIQRENGRYIVHHNVHRWREEDHFSLTITPNNVIDDIHHLGNELVSLGAQPDIVEARLKDVVRGESAKSKRSVIGSDCLSVLISSREARVRFDGKRTRIGHQPVEVPGTPAPWIVTPYGCSPPMLFGVPQSMRYGPLSVRVDMQWPDLVPLRTPSPNRELFVIPLAEPQHRRWGPSRPKPPPPPVLKRRRKKKKTKRRRR